MWNEIKKMYLEKNPIENPIKGYSFKSIKKNESIGKIFREKSISTKIKKIEDKKKEIKIFDVNNTKNIFQIYKKQKQKNNLKKNKFPIINNSNSSSNFKSTEIKVRRKILFSDSSYPLSINDSDNELIRFSMTNSASFFLNKSKSNNNIIEELDDEIKMMKFLPKDASYILNDNFKFHNKESYFIINKLKYLIHHHENSNNENKLNKIFSIGRNKKENITLNLYSFCIKILDLENKEIQTLYIPFNIINLFYAISYEYFILFLTQILEINPNDNLLKIKTNLNDIIHDFSNMDNIELFDFNSNFFSNNSQIINSFSFLKKDKELKLEIIPPKIELIKNNIFIYKIAGKGLLLYLYKNNFQKWEIPTLCYLSSFKIFRQSISKLFYKLNNFENIILNIDDENRNNLTMRNNNKKINQKNFFYQLNNNGINFITFTSYIIGIKIDDNENIFQISFIDFKNLYKLSKKYNIKDIIYKCSLINEKKKTAFFSLDLLNGIKINNLDNFFYKFEENNNKKIQINIKQPTLHWKEYNKNIINKIVLYSVNLEEKILDDLVKINIIEWNHFFCSKYEIINKIINEKELNRRFSLQNNFNSQKSKLIRKFTNRKTTFKKMKTMKFED